MQVRYPSNESNAKSLKLELKRQVHSLNTRQIWDPYRLNQYELGDYVKSAKSCMPKKMAHQEDVLLLWLAYHQYDCVKAVKSLIEYYG